MPLHHHNCQLESVNRRAKGGGGRTNRIPPMAFSTLTSQSVFCPCSALNFLSISRFMGMTSFRVSLRSFSVLVEALRRLA